MRTNKFRGKKNTTSEWVYGSLISTKEDAYAIVQQRNNPVAYGVIQGWCFGVKPQTVGQLIYTSKKGVEYYEGDIYYCAGYGNDVVSELCQIHDRLLCGESEDIGDIIGNIHENPELLKEMP